MATLGTYQMLWDCPFCETKKLLGLTHRHCPNCGAAQDPKARYFPSEADKVAVEDHRYAGADKVCPSCGTPNGALANNCGNCGSALEGAKDAGRLAERAAAATASQSVERAEKAQRQAPPVPVASPKKRGLWGLGCGVGCAGLVLAGIAIALVAVFWTRSAALTVTGHSWTRSVDVEVYGPTQASAWCDQMPANATNVSKSREVRSHNKVADGQSCTTKQVDNGDGTFKEVQNCTPRYTDTPVYDDKCSYTVDTWAKARTVSASGKSLAAKPSWPDTHLGRTGQCTGCEREGARHESYSLSLADQGRKTYACDLGEDRWEAMADGSRWNGEIGVVTGSVDCGTLRQ